jgi:hypothetical protein
MATSSRQSAIFGANDWKTLYQTFRQADFQSYDYETLRKSFVDYLRLYYPETFNDYTESSEYIALLDIIAFMGQALAFRGDLNARENFIDTAERRDSVIKLANLINYTPKRNLAARGFIKITSIQTTENITDINGLNLSGVPVIWNDPANPQWLEQFHSIINASLIDSQRVGRPGNSNTIQNVKTDEYSISLPGNSLPIVPFSGTVSGTPMNFELVSVTSLDEDFVYEIPPSPNGKFNILYRNDKLGYGSPNTGFFCYFKQGSLINYDFTISQQVSNQVVDVNVEGINNDDTWLFQVDNTTGDRTQWTQVENIYDNSMRKSTAEKKVFSVNSGANDVISFIFGDGVFGEIPIGTFRAYLRSSNALTYTIQINELRNISVSLSYQSRYGRVETLTMTLDLQLPVTNAQARESLTNIKERAPSRFYTQNRMVNGEDYNSFPFTLFSSIIKSKAVNRTSIGVARNFDLLDPTSKYSSTNSFSSDGALFQDDSDGSVSFTVNSVNDVVQFLTEDFVSILGSRRVRHYYEKIFSRFDPKFVPGNATPYTTAVYWKQLSVNGSDCTGYFYVKETISGQPVEIPVPIGIYSTTNLAYATVGALLKIEAPIGFTFNEKNKLVPLGTNPDQTTSYWTSILNVIGDGYNIGNGAMSDNTGPITLKGIISDGCKMSLIIPSFSNSLSSSLIQECIRRIELGQNFSLVFDNTLTTVQERWSIAEINDPNAFIKFTSLGNNRYGMTYKSISYFFGSVADTRFVFETDKLVYDPKSGKILKDHINVLKTNTKPNSLNALGRDYILNIIGQPVQADGYADDYSVEVTCTHQDNSNITVDPDFFASLTGYEQGGSTFGKYTFFQKVTDAYLLDRVQVVPTSDVVFTYANQSQIETVKYEYPEGQVFYAYAMDKFFTIEKDNTILNLMNVVELSNYTLSTGRQGFFFQYRHNSNNTSRINPGTTNIIDLYLVTQAYYNSYNNWIKDTTDTLIEPEIPTINQLTDAYSKINDYKMMSDSVILNSVKFKPLFGNKAAPKLQATIKVIKSSSTRASDSEIRSAVLDTINEYFNIDNWNFGDTFYFSELSAYLHKELGDYVSSVVIVPKDPTLSFGALYEIRCAPYEIFVNAAQATDIVVVSALTNAELLPS